jgi:hypothetical protein
MSSIGSVITQRPFRSQNFVVVASGFAYNAATVEGSAPTGVVAGAGTQQIQVNNYANAIATGAAADLLSTTGDLPTTAGMLFRDMGRTVRVFVNGYLVYTLAKVQRMNDDSGVAEGVTGAASTATLSGYETYYVCTWSSKPADVGVTVARVGGQ